MWPFNRRKPARPVSPDRFLFTQVDITERFGDDISLSSDQWMTTHPLNADRPNPELLGLPKTTASADEVHAMASKLSLIRESLRLPRDGVYCPVCHIANVDLKKLRMPCPMCGRELLQFGWD